MYFSDHVHIYLFSVDTLNHLDLKPPMLPLPSEVMAVGRGRRLSYLAWGMDIPWNHKWSGVSHCLVSARINSVAESYSQEEEDAYK